MTAYDDILYPSYSHPQTHPDNLAVVGSLFGLAPRPITRCRVLELGCGNGSNLVPMAWGLPESDFVGIDLAEVPVERGAAMARDLGMKNARLITGDVMQIDASWGEFDYIIAHGLYSWVPAPVREAILGICRTNLAPEGIAFVSYNAYPGSHLRQMLREMLLFHVRSETDPREKLEQGLALLGFLREAHVNGQDEYALWLQREVQRAQALDRSHIFHDDLAEINSPVYFHEFIANSARHGLQFVGEADFFEMSDHIFAPNIRDVLKGTAHDRILREQYLDFLKCRRFRQTLLCRAEARVSHEPLPAAVAGFHISTKAKQGSSEQQNAATYKTPRGARIQTDYRLGQVMLDRLSEVAPREVPFNELLASATAREAAGENGSAEQAREFLLRLYAAGAVKFSSHPPARAERAGAYPVSSPVARWQIERGATVTSLDHQILQVEDEIGKMLIRKLDGTRDRARVVSELLDLIPSRGANPDDSEAETRARVERDLEANLRKLASLGLLVA